MRGSPEIALIFLFALFLRWSVTYHPHSGQDKPPMFGDYEAQRHWQEITLNLPIEKWYINSTDNDLLYWGLDYPPLTAYHSYLLGFIGNKINSSYTKLNDSRGISTPDHKYFMRLTVLCADALIYIPAVIYFMSVQYVSQSSQNQKDFFGIKHKYLVLLTALTYPGLILIDHGHFQYNCVSLGLFILAVAFLLQDSFVMGSLFFVCALNYKQMELYHALPIFFYILGKHTPQRYHWLFCLKKIFYVSVTVLAMFALIWLPFIKDWNVFSKTVLRLFPLQRGVFEDKVSNIWCAINVIYKLNLIFTNEQLAQLCLIVTAIAVLPNCLKLYSNPSRNMLLLSLINSALGFFLFSFQVHEKSILLAAIPVLLYFHKDPLICFWFLLISHFSMLPLYIKDDLFLAYCATAVFYFFFVIWMWQNIFNQKTIWNAHESDKTREGSEKVQKFRFKYKRGKSVTMQPMQMLSKFYKTCINISPIQYDKTVLMQTIFGCSLLGIIVLSIASRFVTPPDRYPDLFPLLVSVYSCGHFLVFYMYFNYQQFFVSRNANRLKAN